MSRLYLGIDIGGTRLKAGVVDETGRNRREAEAASPLDRAALESALAQLIREVSEGVTLYGAGFGCKGIIDPETTVVKTMPGVWRYLQGVRLSSFVEGLLPEDAPVRADNDAKAALAGELQWGAARGRRHVILLTLGTGIGGAILSEGRILRGAGDVAGHLGHLTVDPGGPLCICGNRGCLETYFSARAIESEAWSRTHLGIHSPMCNLLRARPGELSTKLVFDMAAQGDAVARDLLARRITVLAGALAGLLHALDPELVILTGSIAEAGPALFTPLQDEVDRRVHGLLQRSVPILPPGLRDTSGIVGAAALAVR
jgi:glucokinase